MRAHMLSMLSLTPPLPTARHWVDDADLRSPSMERTSVSRHFTLPRPASLSKLLHKTALLLHP